MVKHNSLRAVKLMNDKRCWSLEVNEFINGHKVCSSRPIGCTAYFALVVHTA